jgi:alpha-galactosidase
LYRNEFIPNTSLLYDTKDSAFYVTDWMSEEREGFKESSFWRYYENWAKVWKGLRNLFPQVILQQCANCGTREDIGTFELFDETNTSEGPPQTMIGLLAGKTLCIPPEVIEMGYGTAKERGPLDTYLRVNYTLAMPQHVTGIAPSLEELPPVVRDQCRHYAEIYKTFIRPILPVSRVFHHNPSFLTGANPWEDPWFAMEYASPSGERGWATIVHRAFSSGSVDYLFKPRGLKRSSSYKVTFDSTGEQVLLSGNDLIEKGILLHLESVMSSELLLFETAAGL